MFIRDDIGTSIFMFSSPQFFPSSFVTKAFRLKSKSNWAKILLVMDTFTTCFLIFRLNQERYTYKLFVPDRVYT